MPLQETVELERIIVPEQLPPYSPRKNDSVTNHSG